MEVADGCLILSYRTKHPWREARLTKVRDRRPIDPPPEPTITMDEVTMRAWALRQQRRGAAPQSISLDAFRRRRQG
jgi:hypothetical protein